MAAQQNSTVDIVDIQVNYQDAVRDIATYRSNIAQLKKDQEELKSQLKAGTISQQEFDEAMAATNINLKNQKDAMAALNKQVLNQIRTEQQQEGSLQQLRAEMSNLNAQYDAMSRAEREGASGVDLQLHIAEIANEIKEAEFATERYYRNVGNYQSAFDGLDGKLDEAKNLVATLTEELKNNTQAQEESKSTVESLTAINELASQRLDDAKAKYEELTKTLGENAQATIDAKAEMESLSNSVATSATKLEEAKAKMESLQQSVTETKTSLDNAKGAVDQLKAAQDLATSASEGLKTGLIGAATGGNALLGSLVKVVTSAEGVSGGMTMATFAVKSLTTASLSFIATPIGAILMAIVGVLTLFKTGLETSEEKTNRWKVALAPLKIGLDAILNVCTAVTGVLLDIIEGLEDMVGTVMEAAESIPLLGDSIKAVNDSAKERIAIQQEQIRYEKLVREEIEQSAESEKKLEQLRSIIMDKQNYSLQERKKALKEQLAEEEKYFNRKMELAKLNLSILEREAALTENDAEMNNKLAQARAALLNVEKEYAQFKTQWNKMNNKLAKEEKSAADSVTAAHKKSADAAQKAADAAKERASKETAALRQVEQELLKLLDDTILKRRKQVELQYRIEIEELQKRLTTEKNLTETAREAIKQTIILKQTELNKELEKLSLDEITRQSQIQLEIVNKQIEAQTVAGEELYNLKKQQLQLQYDAEAQSLAERFQNQQLTESQYYALLLAQDQKFANDRAALDLENEDRKRDTRMQILENQLAELEIENSEITEAKQTIEDMGLDVVTDGEMKILEKEREIAAQRLQDIIDQGQLETETVEQFEARKLAAEQKRVDAENKLKQASLKNEKAYLGSMQSITGSLMSLTDAIGESNEEFAMLSKVLTLAQIAIDTGKAISAGIAAASGVPFPGNIAAIATTIATVVTNMATAISTVNSAKFATGAVNIRGAGTSTSDSIPARISNGESVINAKATKMFAPVLEAMNAIGNGAPLPTNYNSYRNVDNAQLMTDAFVQAAKEIRPVVSVEEINDVSHQVEVIQSLDNL